MHLWGKNQYSSIPIGEESIQEVLDWLDKYYKQKLEKNMISDTLFLIAQK